VRIDVEILLFFIIIVVDSFPIFHISITERAGKSKSNATNIKKIQLFFFYSKVLNWEQKNKRTKKLIKYIQHQGEMRCNLTTLFQYLLFVQTQSI